MTNSSTATTTAVVATRRAAAAAAAAAEIHGRYTQMHTRTTSYSSVQLSGIVTLYQVQVLWLKHAHGDWQKELEKKLVF